MSTKIWLSSPHMGGTEENYVKEAFDTNWIAPLGPNVSGFENDLEHYLGKKKCSLFVFWNSSYTLSISSIRSWL